MTKGRLIGTVVKSIITHSVKENILLDSCVCSAAWCRWKEFAMCCWSWANGVYDNPLLLKLDVSGRKGTAMASYRKHDTTHSLLWITSS